ncbi:MAG: acyltransferase [Comamonas sp.]
MNIYPNFHTVRLLLALEVVVSHASPYFLGQAWDGWIMAVPAFLGVSGFLVLHSHSHTRNDGVFLKKRALRVLPAMLASLALGFFLLDTDYLRHSFIVWLTGGWVLLGAANTPLWSLLWEEVAYVSLLMLARLGTYRHRGWVWALFGVALTAGWAVYESDASSYVRVLATLPASFFIGNLVYLYRHQLTRRGAWGGWGPWVALLAVIAMSALKHSGVLPWGPPFWLQVVVVVWLGLAGRALLPMRSPDLSYGMYVYHMPVLDSLHRAGLWSSYGAGAAMVYFAAVVLLAAISWYGVEKPVLSLKRRLVSSGDATMAGSR